MMFSSTLLRTFRAVAQDLSFTKAATRLNLTQSSVSAQIRRLEEQAGAALLDRSTRSVALTAQGQILLGYARAILRLHDNARMQLSAATHCVHIRIGASDDVMGWLPSVLQQFQEDNAGSSVELRVANTGLLLASMDQGDLDLVVGCKCQDGRVGKLLWREPLLWAYAEDVPLDCRGPLPLALFPEPCSYRDAALSTLAAAGREWRVAAVSPSIRGLRAAVLSGFAVSPLNRSSFKPKMRVLGWEMGFPKMPDVEFMVFLPALDAPKEVEALSDAIVRSAQ